MWTPIYLFSFLFFRYCKVSVKEAYIFPLPKSLTTFKSSLEQLYIGSHRFDYKGNSVVIVCYLIFFFILPLFVKVYISMRPYVYLEEYTKYSFYFSSLPLLLLFCNNRSHQIYVTHLYTLFAQLKMLIEVNLFISTTLSIYQSRWKVE